MTIQLLQQYNGASPGIYTYSNAEETRLIGLGLARAYTAGMDGENPVFTTAEIRSTKSLVSGGGIGPVTTFASLPSAAANAGASYRVSDIGKPGAGSIWISDGARWLPLNGQVQALSSALPIIMPSNGSVAANGALTLNVALDTTYAQGCYMYFAAGQVYSGSAAGFYYVVMSLTTAGTIYNNVLAATGWPTQPASPTAIVAAGPGSYTGDNGADRTALSITLPGGSLGISGRLRSRLTVQASTASGTRNAKVIYGSYAYHVIGLTSTNTFACTTSEAVNLGAANRQRGTTYDSSAGFNGNVAYSPTSSSTDSSTDQTLTVTLRNSAGTEWLMLTTADVVIGS